VGYRDGVRPPERAASGTHDDESRRLTVTSCGPRPLILGYLLAGVAIGPFTPGPTASSHSVEVLAEIGVAFLMCALGAELAIAELRRIQRAPRPGFEPGTYRLTALRRAEPSNFAVFRLSEFALCGLPRSPLSEVGGFHSVGLDPSGFVPRCAATGGHWTRPERARNPVIVPSHDYPMSPVTRRGGPQRLASLGGHKRAATPDVLGQANEAFERFGSGEPHMVR
jgi:sodium/hydrogen exchanger family protein